MGAYKFAGVNKDGLTNIKTAIDNYIKNIDDYIKTINVDEAVGNAYKGDYVSAIKDYIAAVGLAIKNVYKPLDECNAMIDTVLKSYNDTDSTIKSGLASDKEKINPTA